MMADQISELGRAIVAARAIDDATVLKLRQIIWTNQALDRETLDHLFQINDALAAPSVGFSDLFCEAIVHFALRQSVPHGFITPETADWLDSRFQTDGRLESHAELETLVHLLEKAENAPDSLKQQAMAQIQACILSGVGPTRKAGDIRPGRVDAAEVQLLRRLIFASGGDSSVSVSANEAEMLFRIKDATLNAENAPEWTTLFVEGVGNYLMAHNFFRQTSLDEAKSLNTAMDDTQSSIGGFLGRTMGAFSLNTLVRPASLLADSKRVWVDDAALAADRAISSNETNWLKQQIAADDKTDDLEKALLAFIADETASAGAAPEAERRYG